MPISIINTAGIAAATLAIPLAIGGMSGPVSDLPATETVEVAPGAFEFPRPGVFMDGKRRVPAAVDRVAFSAPVEIMTHLVSLADYRLCVSEGMCKPPDAVDGAGAGDLPVTGVDFHDARAYAAWYSARTGMRWRLPTDTEWAWAAAERFEGETVTGPDDPGNPAIAWIRDYREASGREREPRPRPRGAFGPNSNGIYDFAGNVWEWTTACYVRVTLAPDGTGAASTVENCGVRVLEGRHRAYMPDFVREGKSGACAVGVPPDNLGFRLVKESAAAPVVARLWRTVRALASAAR